MPLGHRHNPRLIVHAIRLLLLCCYFVCVSESSREIKRLIMETGEICNKINSTGQD